MPATALIAASSFGLPEPWELFLGRLHPTLVHFPVALLLLALLLEVWRVRKRGPVPSGAALPCLVFGALGAVVAAASGWLLGEHDDPGRGVADLLLWHRWLGVAVASLASVAAVLALSGRAGTRPRAVETSRFLLCWVAVLIPIVGHLGGSMVHGREYLTGPLRAALESCRAGAVEAPAVATAVVTAGDREAAAHDPSSPAVDGAPAASTDGAPVVSPVVSPDGTIAGAPATEPQAVVAAAASLAPVDFVADVKPILDARCVECHGPQKSKADLRLDQRLDEGQAPRVIVPGDPDGSELVKRVSLPWDDFDVMPAKGDPLTEAQIDVLRRWIAEGAAWGPLADGDDPASSDG